MDAFSARRVLVVDDNRDVANSVAALLRLLGHTVLPAYDGPTAVALAANFKPDIAILDLVMPGMDGFEVARQLRAMDGLQSLKVVALTAMDELTLHERAGAEPFSAHLFKPTTAQELMTVLA